MTDTPLSANPAAPPAGGAPDPRRGRLGRLRTIDRHLFAVRVVLNALLVLALLYTLALTHSLIIPLVLAAFIGLGLNPIVAAAARWRVPRAATAALLMLVLGFGIGAGIASLAQPASTWLQRVPRVLRHVTPKLKPLTQKINAATQATSSLTGTQTTRRQQPARAVFTASDLLKVAPRIVGSVLVVGLLVFFFLVFGDAMLRRLVEISPTFEKKRLNVALVRNIQVEVSRYLLTTAMINGTLGALTAAWLWGLGVEDPLLWGGLVAMANFIPYVGAITMTMVLAMVGMLQFHGLWHGLLPAAGFACLSATEGNFVTPLIMGRRMRLSPVAILVWLMIWGWIWGIPGALMAVPMLTIVKLVTEQLPGWTWFAQMVGRGSSPHGNHQQ